MRPLDRTGAASPLEQPAPTGPAGGAETATEEWDSSEGEDEPMFVDVARLPFMLVPRNVDGVVKHVLERIPGAVTVWHSGADEVSAQRSADAVRNGLPSLTAPSRLNAQQPAPTGPADGAGGVSTPRELWIHLVDTELPVWLVLELTQRVCRHLRRAAGFTPTGLALAMRFLKTTFVEGLTDDGFCEIISQALRKVREGVNDMSLWKDRYPDASDLACKLYSLVTADLRMADPGLDWHIHLGFAEVAGSDDFEEQIIVQLALQDDTNGGMQWPSFLARIKVTQLDTSVMDFDCVFCHNAGRTRQEFQAIEAALNPSGLLMLCRDETVIETRVEIDSIDVLRRHINGLSASEQRETLSQLLSDHNVD